MWETGTLTTTRAWPGRRSPRLHRRPRRAHGGSASATRRACRAERAAAGKCPRRRARRRQRPNASSRWPGPAARAAPGLPGVTLDRAAEGQPTDVDSLVHPRRASKRRQACRALGARGMFAWDGALLRVRARQNTRACWTRGGLVRIGLAPYTTPGEPSAWYWPRSVSSRAGAMSRRRRRRGRRAARRASPGRLRRATADPRRPTRQTLPARASAAWPCPLRKPPPRRSEGRRRKRHGLRVRVTSQPARTTPAAARPRLGTTPRRYPLAAATAGPAEGAPDGPRAPAELPRGRGPRRAHRDGRALWCRSRPVAGRPAATDRVLDAFRLGMDVVTANKGPIAWSWPRVSAAAACRRRPPHRFRAP